VPTFRKFKDGYASGVLPFTSFLIGTALFGTAPKTASAGADLADEMELHNEPDQYRPVAYSYRDDCPHTMRLHYDAAKEERCARITGSFSSVHCD
jgi:hypothetical protein